MVGWFSLPKNQNASDYIHPTQAKFNICVFVSVPDITLVHRTIGACGLVLYDSHKSRNHANRKRCTQRIDTEYRAIIRKGDRPWGLRQAFTVPTLTNRLRWKLSEEEKIYYYWVKILDILGALWNCIYYYLYLKIYNIGWVILSSVKCCLLKKLFLFTL